MAIEVKFPVLPKDLKTILPKFHGSLCDEIAKMGQFDILIKSFSLFVSDGCNFTDGFKSVLCNARCETTTTTTTCIFPETTSTTTGIYNCNCDGFSEVETNYPHYPGGISEEDCNVYINATCNQKNLCTQISSIPISTMEALDWSVFEENIWNNCNGQAVLDFLVANCGYVFIQGGDENFGGGDIPPASCLHYVTVARLV